MVRQKQFLTPQTESQLLREIIRAVYPYVRIHRANVGSVVTKSGRRFSTGLPKGFPDLFGYRRSDGKAVFIECRLAYNKPSQEQQRYINEAAAAGAIAGVCYCVEDALRLIQAST